MNVEITGKIKVIFDEQTFNSGFKKKEFVVTTQEQYPQDLKLELIQDKTTLIDGLNQGDEITAQVNLRGNEYNGRYYVNLQAWRIEKASGSSEGAAPEATPPQNNAPLPEEPNGFDDQDDDLPF
jgi:single-stranded DNA-binding protein